MDSGKTGVEDETVGCEKDEEKESSKGGGIAKTEARAAAEGESGVEIEN